jgi:hypothetical protein
VVFEAVEVRRPELAVRGEPVVQLRERFRANAVKAPLRFGARFDESGLLEDAEVLGDRRLTDAEAVDEVTDRPFAVAEQIQDLQPARFAKGFECGELGHGPSMTT